MSNLYKLDLVDEEHLTAEGEPSFRCVVEAPRGSPVKFKYDPKHKVFVMGRELPAGQSYPFDWGFLPSTAGEDGDPIDVMIIHDAPSATGIVISAQLIGVLEASQREDGGDPEQNDRFFAVPVGSRRQETLSHVDQLPKRMREELEEFFVTTSSLAHKELRLRGWHGPKRARELVREAVRRLR
jgi:inorganic pyrophosphatase